MGKRFKLLKKMKKILKDVDRHPELEEKLMPYYNQAKKDGLTIQDVELFIKEYERIKNEEKVLDT